MSAEHTPLILIADDMLPNRKAMRNLVHSLGYSTIEAEDGLEAVRQIELHHPQLVLLDLIMPEMDGREVLEIINQRFPEIAVIVVTMESDEKTVDYCLSLGAASYLLKPIDPLRTRTEIQLGLRLHDAIEAANPDQKVPDPNATMFKRFVTDNGEMAMAINAAIEAGQHNIPIIITGEYGSGKSFLSRCLHEAINTTGSFTQIDLRSAGKSWPEMLHEIPIGSTVCLEHIEALDQTGQLVLRDWLCDAPRQHGLLLLIGDIRACQVTADHSSAWREVIIQSGAMHVHLMGIAERREDIRPLVKRFIPEISQQLDIEITDELDQLADQLEKTPPRNNVRGIRDAVQEAIKQVATNRQNIDSFPASLLR